MTEETPVPKTLTPADIHQTVAAAPSAADGLHRVLAMSSGAYLPDDQLEAVTAAIQARGEGEPYVQTLRHPLEFVQSERYRGVTEWELRERSLRTLLREGKVFAALPVITVHQIDPADDNGLSPTPPLTEEQIAELPGESWVEVRLTVPIRSLPDAAPAAPEPSLEPR